MGEPFHRGEIEVQSRAGARGQALAVGRGLFAELPPGSARFLARQRLAVAASLEPGGRVWASLVAGPAGFLEPVDDGLLRLATEPPPGDPLAENLAARPELGLLVFDPETRRRLRVNGRGLQSADGIFLLVERAYGNCSKYIQLRRALADGEPPAEPVQTGERLSATQQRWIAGADTFFIASFHPEGGADASHRGGFPGFVRVEGSRRLAFDHYPGNGMFNTLGNLVESPRAGLLFVDFTTGDLLQLSGRAVVLDDLAVSFTVDAVRETRGASPLRFELLEYSPAIPASSRSAAAGIQRTTGDPPKRRDP